LTALARGLFDATTIIARQAWPVADRPRTASPQSSANSGNKTVRASGIIGNPSRGSFTATQITASLGRDDISPDWLAIQALTGDAVTALETASGESTWPDFFGATRSTPFQPPGLPEIRPVLGKLREWGDAYSDVVVDSKRRRVYTGNLKKQSRNCGAAWDDHVMLLVIQSPPKKKIYEAHAVDIFVETAQVLPPSENP